MRPARRQRARQVFVADENRARSREGDIPENMVGMDMGVDDIADRLVGLLRSAARNASPSARLPPVSITATASSPTIAPRLAMPPRFSRVISAVSP